MDHVLTIQQHVVAASIDHEFLSRPQDQPRELTDVLDQADHIRSCSEDLSAVRGSLDDLTEIVFSEKSFRSGSVRSDDLAEIVLTC